MEDLAAEARALRQLTGGLSASSASVYASHVKRFKRWCAFDQRMSWPPDMAAVAAYELSLRADGIYASTARNSASVVGRFLRLLDPRQAVELEVVPVNGRNLKAASSEIVAVPPTALSVDDLILASLGLSVDATGTASVSQADAGTAAFLALSDLIEGLEHMVNTLDLALTRAQEWAA